MKHRPKELIGLVLNLLGKPSDQSTASTLPQFIDLFENFEEVCKYERSFDFADHCLKCIDSVELDIK